jgi:hypothetical protein
VVHLPLSVIAAEEYFAAASEVTAQPVLSDIRSAIDMDTPFSSPNNDIAELRSDLRLSSLTANFDAQYLASS